MKLMMLKTNVVVTAAAHNPTVLHPAFLESQGIVTGAEPMEPPICTPAFASVKYKNGLAFAVTGDRLDVTDTRLEANFTSSEAPATAVNTSRCCHTFVILALALILLAF